MSQKEEKEEFEPKSLTKLPTVEMQVLRDNNKNRKRTRIEHFPNKIFDF